jgi:P27 family predicted phage terminase small subunit
MPRKKSKQLHDLHNSADARNGFNSVTLPVVEKVITPSHLPRVAQLLYRKTALVLQSRGLLTELDLPLLEAYATSYFILRDATESLKKDGTTYESKGRRYTNPNVEILKRAATTMRDLSLKFGLNPKDRAALESPIETDDDNDGDGPDVWN